MKKSTDNLMLVLLAVSGITIIIGAILKIKQIPPGDILLKIGFLASLFFAGIEIWRLRSIVEKLKHKD